MLTFPRSHGTVTEYYIVASFQNLISTLFTKKIRHCRALIFNTYNPCAKSFYRIISENTARGSNTAQKTLILFARFTFFTFTALSCGKAYSKGVDFFFSYKIASNSYILIKKLTCSSKISAAAAVVQRVFNGKTSYFFPVFF